MQWPYSAETACVCVWHICIDVKLLFLVVYIYAGEWSRPAELHLTKLSAVSWGYHWRRPVTYLLGCDHLFFRVCFLSHFWLTWQAAKPRTAKRKPLFHGWRNLNNPCGVHYTWSPIHRRYIVTNLHVTGLSSCRINIMIHSYLVWFLWWLRHGAIGPIEATPVGVNVDWIDFRINTF